MWKQWKIKVLPRILIMGCVLLGMENKNMINAWWGILYPQYCYSEVSDCGKNEIKYGFLWIQSLIDKIQ
jgi:hypothetical protein